jgi:hypothetical protein
MAIAVAESSKRKKALKVFSHIEIRGQAGGAVIEQHYTSDEHKPQSYELRTRPVARARAVQTGMCSETSRDGVSATRSQSAEESLGRRKQTPKPEEQAWTKRGLFKAGFNIGQPRLRGAKLFTKGKER